MFITVIDVIIVIMSLMLAAVAVFIGHNYMMAALLFICGMFILLVYLAYRILWRLNIIRRLLGDWQGIVDKLKQAGL